MTAFEPSVELVPGLSAQIEKIVNHELFKGSEALRRILLYLGEHAVQNPGRPTREYEIATHVLGRPEDFDARADSCVRVQVGRLRSRLRRYYAGPGADDPIAISIPLGSYMLVAAASERPTAPASSQPGPVAVPARANVATGREWRSYGLVGVVCLLLGVILGASIARYVEQPPPSWIVHDVNGR